MYDFGLNAADQTPSEIHSTPNVSPCRDCEYWDQDKDEHPACVNCIKRGWFRTSPINMDIDRSFTLPKAKKRKHTHRRGKPLASSHKCTRCRRQAYYKGFKDLYNKPICNRCYKKFAHRFKKTGDIRDKWGRL